MSDSLVSSRDSEGTSRSAQDKLESIHEALFAKDNLDAISGDQSIQRSLLAKARQDVKRAKKIQEFLWIIKNQNFSGESDLVQSMWGDLEDQLVNDIIQNLRIATTEIMNQTRSSVTGKRSGLKSSALFKRKHFKDVTNRQSTALTEIADSVFEEEIAALFKALNNVAVKESQGQINIPVSITGQVQGSVNTSDYLNDFLEKHKKEAFNTINHTFEQGKQLSIDANKIFNPVVADSVKSDIEVGYCSVDFSTGYQGWVYEILALIQGSKFTLKNYQQYHWFQNGMRQSRAKNAKPGTMVKNMISKLADEKVHLGETNQAKAILGALQGQVGLSGGDSRGMLYHAINSLYYNDSEYEGRAHSSESAVTTHLMHLRYIYELTGAGLKRERKTDQQMLLDEFDGADFVIYNNPDGEGIYVKSTAELLWRRFANEDGNYNFVNSFVDSLNIFAKSYIKKEFDEKDLI